MARIPRSIREQVRQRAGGRCEYCRKPESASFHAHHVEHITALKHRGQTTLDNLAWACFQCNIAKGPDIASLDAVTGELTRLFNPRVDSWEDHFELHGLLIAGRTPIGRVTVELLQINHPDQIEIRMRLINAGLW